MTGWFDALAAAIGIALATGILHVLRSRQRADALLAAQLAGSCSVGIILLLGHDSGSISVSLDLALVAALLAALTAIAFAALGWHEDRPTPVDSRSRPGVHSRSRPGQDRGASEERRA